MSDTKERFQVLDQIETPDRWAEILESVPTRSRGRRLARFAAVLAATLVVTVGLVAFLFASFKPNRSEPVSSTAPTPTVEDIALGAPRRLDLHLVQGAPLSVEEGFGSLWVIGSFEQAGVDQLRRIDPQSGATEAKFDMPVSGSGEWGGDGLVIGDGYVWATAWNSATVYRIDPGDDSVTRMPFEGRIISGLAIDEVTGDLWIAVAGKPEQPWSLMRLNPADGSVISSTESSTNFAGALLPLGGTVWQSGQNFEHSTYTGSFLHQLIPGSPSDLETGASFARPITDGHWIWTPFSPENTYANASSKIAQVSASGDIVASWDVRGLGYDVAVGDDGGVWFLGGKGLERLNPETGTIQSWEAVPDGETPTFVVPGSGGVWVGTYEGSLYFRPIEGRFSTAPSPSEVSDHPTAGGSYLPPHLAGGNGWDSRSSGPVSATGQNGAYAWASTIPISEDDVRLRAAIPPTTITELPPDGIVVTVEVVPSAFLDKSVPFPYADLSFDLTQAKQRGPEAEEPAGNYSVLQMNDNEAATLVRVYFGSPSPSSSLIASAQAELDTLQLPPTCTVQGEGAHPVSISTTEASADDSLTLAGSVPFQREDGSFDESGDGQMVAWWNVAPKDWVGLASGSSPSPAVGGEGVIRLGSAPMSTCTFAIPFSVPGVPSGDYPVLVLQQDGTGAALAGAVQVHVSGP